MPVKITLPELIFEPVKYSVGYVQQLLDIEREVVVSRIERYKTGPRSSIECYVLETNEKFLVTRKSNITPPPNITLDGVLRIHDDGRYSWIAHRKITEAKGIVDSIGLTGYVAEIAATWKKNFTYRTADVDETGALVAGSTGLRPPQIGALFAIGSHWSLDHRPATIVMPTGTGKTETMLATLAAHSIKSMIVAVPSKALRRQTARKFLTFGLLRSLGILPSNVPNPLVGVLTRQPQATKDLEIFQNSNVVVSVVASLALGNAQTLAKDIADRCDVLVVDEAHHVAASSWMGFREHFINKKVLQFTATPFRLDGKLVDGHVIFSYALKRAQEDGYFKPINFKPVHELDSRLADELIAKDACQHLRHDIGNGFNHLMMARCGSIQRAEEVLSLYVKYGREFNPQIIHSELKDNEERIAKLIAGECKIAVCVNMLGEGFDLPSLKIAAVHDHQKSLAPLLQFTGRFTRSSGNNLGDATIVANIADLNVSSALERLYSEDSDWNVLLSEMSSQAAKEHARLIEFLRDSTPLGRAVEDVTLSHSLLKPIFSTLTYACVSFAPKRFFNAIPKGVEVISVWLNEKTHTLYFVTRSSRKVKWTRSKEIDDTSWNLFVLHHDHRRSLLYLASSDKSSNHESLAKAVGATAQLSGEEIFRCLARISRLVFNNLGVSKHGRRNLSYAMYTGADVRQALSQTEKAGSRKANISGIGWQSGKQITIGCSYKGRVWSKDSGTIPEFIEWAENVGDKLIDKSIKTSDIIDHVLIPDEISEIPRIPVMGIEWPYELLRQAEERIIVSKDTEDFPLFLCDLFWVSTNPESGEIRFAIVTAENKIIGEFTLTINKTGYFLTEHSTSALMIRVGTLDSPLVDFLRDYPPLVRFIDLSELDGNLLLRPQNPYDLSLSTGSLVSFDWTETDITKESIWKDGIKREDSVQWTIAQKYNSDGFTFIFDDDGPGEASDLICIKEAEDFISLYLVHCKYSGGGNAGARIDDVIEVSSQAVRSARWAGKFKELCRHIINRNGRRRKEVGRSFVLNGSLADVSRLSKAARFKEVRPEIIIVQPGVSISKLTNEQSMVLGACSSYLKQTIGINVSIICST